MTGAMTREEFEGWIRRTGRALTDPDAPIVPCWRFDVRPAEPDAQETR